jgi:hypothetical protein
VTLDDQTFDALSAEATRQDVRLAALVEHALIYFLADVDSGRVGDRLDDALEKYTAGL